MWLSERKRKDNTCAVGGKACAYEDGTGVQTDGEMRCVTICAPGGYYWKPEDEQDVLTVGGEQEDIVITGVEMDDSVKLKPGEIAICGKGGARVLLDENGGITITGGSVKLSGSVELSGVVNINGALYVNGVIYRRCNCNEEE